jgi:hypothetical protein
MVIVRQADETRSKARGAMAARQSFTHWNIEISCLSLRGGKLTSQYKEQLKTQLHINTLTAFVKEKESWTQPKFDTVNWSACGTSFKSLLKTYN